MSRPSVVLPAPSEAASRPPVRRLRVDLARGFDRLWNGDAFRTHYLNALSMSFPVGEQYFIDSVRRAVAMLPADEQGRHAAQVQGFIGQEATHRFLHDQFNAELERQGLRNRWQHWAAWRIEASQGIHPRNHAAVTAGYEHITAVLAKGLLTHPEWLKDASPELALFWRWHAVEESEHKAVAFDVCRAMGCSERRRILWYLYLGVLFLLESTAQTWLNLWHSGHWKRPSTWVQGARFLFGVRGMAWASLPPLLRYLRRDFHPRQLEDPVEMAQWLEAQRASYSIVAE